MDTYSESRRYNEHMCTCKTILNKMKLLLNFTLPSDILLQTHDSLKELNTITNDLLELRDGLNVNTLEGKLNDESNEINSESQNVTQKSKFSLPKIKVESNENEDTNLDRDTDWEPDALPYNASFMSLALSANELEGIESKVSKMCDSTSQTNEEKYKILRSIFFKEKFNNLNINNTSTCFSPICWTRNLNYNKKDALPLITNDSKPKSIKNKKYTFGPTNFIAMQANISAKKGEDNESYEDEPEKLYKDVSVNTKRIKYRQISNRRVDQNNSCDSQCPYEPSVESLPFELIEYEVSQKHYITKNIPKKLKEFTRSSLNKIFDKRDVRRKNDKYPYEPSMSSLPVEFKSTDRKSQVKECTDECDSNISLSSDEDDELSNKEVQTITCDKICDDEDSDEDIESDESTESLISILKEEEGRIDELEDYDPSDKSLISEEDDDEEAEIQDNDTVTAGTDENKMKCVKATCKTEKCTNKNKNAKQDELKQQTEQNNEEFEEIVDALTKQLVSPEDIDKVYYEKGETKCDLDCSINKDISKKREEPKQLTVQEDENEKVTKKVKIDDKKKTYDYKKQIVKKCPVETGIYDQESTECPAKKCMKDQNKKRQKPKPQIIQVDEKLEDDKDKDLYEELKDDDRKSLVQCKIPIKCPRETCIKKDRIKVQDKPKPQVEVERNNVENENKEDDEKMAIKENKEIIYKKAEKNRSVEEMKDPINKLFSCPSEKCKRTNKTKREKSKSRTPQDDEQMIEIIEKKEIVKYKNTCRNMKEDDDDVTENDSMTEELYRKDISGDNESNKSLNLEENEEEKENTQDQNEAITEEMDENEIGLCVKTTCKTEKCLNKNKDAFTEQKIKSPKDIGKIYHETKCEDMPRNKEKSKKRAESKQLTIQEDKNNSMTKKDQIVKKCPVETGIYDQESTTCPAEKCMKNQIKKRQKSKPQIVQEIEKTTEEEKDEEEPVEIECPSEKCKKNLVRKRSKVTIQTTENDLIMSEDENIVLVENEKEKKTPVQQIKDSCRTVKCPVYAECPKHTKIKFKKQDEAITETSQVNEEISDDEKMTEENDEHENETPQRKSILKCPGQITKLPKRCPAARTRKIYKQFVGEMTEIDEPKVQETQQSNIRCIRRRSTASNTNPLPIIQDEATSTEKEGIKIKDMHAWALAYVKLEEDGAKLVQILHTTPYEPGRYLFKEPNELILFGPQASSSKKK